MKNKKMWLLSTESADRDNVAILTFRIEGQNALTASQLCAIEQLYENWDELDTQNIYNTILEDGQCFEDQNPKNCVEKKNIDMVIDDVNSWFEINYNKELFNSEAKKNCLCLFDDGTIINFNDEHPMAILTHFKLAQLAINE